MAESAARRKRLWYLSHFESRRCRLLAGEIWQIIELFKGPASSSVNEGDMKYSFLEITWADALGIFSVTSKTFLAFSCLTRPRLNPHLHNMVESSFLGIWKVFCFFLRHNTGHRSYYTLQGASAVYTGQLMILSLQCADSHCWTMSSHYIS